MYINIVHNIEEYDHELNKEQDCKSDKKHKVLNPIFEKISAVH